MCYMDDNSGKQWQGDSCTVLPGKSTLKLEDSGIIAIVLAIVFTLGTKHYIPHTAVQSYTLCILQQCCSISAIAAGLFWFVTRRRQSQKGESLYDPYDDIRETIYNYDEEGMPEEDQDGYDISRLSKPIYPSHLDKQDYVGQGQ